MLRISYRWSQIVIAILLIAIPEVAMSAADESAAIENSATAISDLSAEPAVAEPTVGRKVQRGLAGIVLGVLEIPATMASASREHGKPAGVVMGLAEGVGRFVARELLGVYQLVTAPFGAPDPYPGILKGEFPWSSFAGEAGGSSASDIAQLTRELGWIRGVEVEQHADSVIVRFPGELLFSVGSNQLSEGAQPRLIGLAETLERNPKIQVDVQGHTDSMGPTDLNQILSERRADSVQDFLIAQGVERERVSASGLGVSQPVASNDTVAGRRANRRVEVELRALPPMVSARE